MNILTKYYRAVKECLNGIDPRVCIALTGGVTVPKDKPMITMGLRLPKIDQTGNALKTSESYVIADRVREWLDERGISCDAVEVNCNDKPAARKKGLIKDWWSIELLLPCPEPKFRGMPYDYSEADDFARRLQNYNIGVMGGYNLLIGSNTFRLSGAHMDPKFTLGEELYTGGRVDIWNETVHIYHQKKCWYVGSFKQGKKVIHCIIRNTNSRSSSFHNGRTLYAVKACLFQDIQE